MYRIIPPAEFVTQAWKNGGGVTHEIARDRDAWGWRFSMAEVAQDGPFSIFAGMARILTVIQGAGLDLHHAGGVMAVPLLRPCGFSGDIAIDARLKQGSIRDFNVIYDPLRFAAEVDVLTGDAVMGNHLTGILALQDDVFADGVPVPLGGFALGAGPVRGVALRVTIQPR